MCRKLKYLDSGMMAVLLSSGVQGYYKFAFVDFAQLLVETYPRTLHISMFRPAIRALIKQKDLSLAQQLLTCFSNQRESPQHKFLHIRSTASWCELLLAHVELDNYEIVRRLFTHLEETDKRMLGLALRACMQMCVTPNKSPCICLRRSRVP